MIKKWIVGNFKSVAEPTELSLARVTVFAGANSTGKSTVLQSVLAVSQTVRATTGKYPLVLNGEYTRLGYLRDTINEHSGTRPLVLGFVIDTPDPTPTSNSPKLCPIRLVFQVSADEAIEERPYGLLKEVEITWATGHITLRDAAVSEVDIFSNSGRMHVPSGIRDELQQGMYAFSPKTDSSMSLASIPPFKPQFDLYSFLPGKYLETYDHLNEDLKRILLHLADLIQGDISINDQNALKDIRRTDYLAKPLKTMIQDILTRTSSSQNVGTQSYNVLRVAVAKMARGGSVEDGIRHLLLEYPSGYRSRLAKEFRDAARDIQLRSKDVPMPEIGVKLRNAPVPLDQVTDQITQYFRKNIYYLGPLREPPQYLYILPPFPDIRYVGTKGEFTAAVLERYQGDQVDFPLPPDPNRKGHVTIDRGPLIYALQLWLEQMALLEEVKTQDRGKIGTEMTVRASGVSRDLDLTSIGVGVSQVLPTMVGCLVAPRGTTFLLEQPELHLHPKVQADLADFFIGLTRIGKQVIIETHSEYLINRLRRRIAEDEDDALAASVQIYFVEREHGKSSFRPVNFSEYGAALEWPKGFFDEGPTEAQLILEAAMRKRRRKRAESEQQNES